jgi:[ribosomal protein S5]-alanine N-acetyltransferase
LEHERAELENPDQLRLLLDAEVSAAWPPGEYDRDAMEFFRARLEEGGAEVEGWYGWYAVREADREGPRALVGAGGYLGPPDPSGVVEIGYSVLPEWQRRGYASEIVEALVTRAFARPGVRQVIAHTTLSNVGSVAVLMRCGFQQVGTGAEAGSIRFECVAPHSDRASAGG